MFVICRYWPIPCSMNRPYGKKKKEKGGGGGGGGNLVIGKLVPFWISNFRRVVNVPFFMGGGVIPQCEFYVPMFRNTVPSA